MTSITQWHEYNDQEKLAWLMAHVIQGATIVAEDHQQPKYDLLFIRQCEQTLDAAQRKLYMRYMNSAIANLTYDGLSDEEQQSDETSDKFYWNYLTADHDLRGRCIWNVVADFAP